MAQRKSEFERRESDFYPTPVWCTELLCVKLKNLGYLNKQDVKIWEPACGDHAMLNVLKDQFPHAHTLGTDIRDDYQTDFLTCVGYDAGWDAIITNPPYRKDLIRAFIDRALAYTKESNGLVAMLMRVDFDSAKTRADIFGEHPAWFGKIVLNKRVVWFDNPDCKASPSENHAWYIWDWSKVPSKPPIIMYGPH